MHNRCDRHCITVTTSRKKSRRGPWQAQLCATSTFCCSHHYNSICITHLRVHKHPWPCFTLLYYVLLCVLPPPSVVLTTIIPFAFQISGVTRSLRKRTRSHPPTNLTTLTLALTAYQLHHAHTRSHPLTNLTTLTLAHTRPPASPRPHDTLPLSTKVPTCIAVQSSRAWSDSSV
jgi:hypothetical protein